MPEARSITIRGTTWPSIGAAARALGVTPRAITQAEEYGYLDRVGEGRRTPKPVTLGGWTYPTQRAAAAALGVNEAELYGYLRVSRLLDDREET
jgi:hypothetical protein